MFIPVFYIKAWFSADLCSGDKSDAHEMVVRISQKMSFSGDLFLQLFLNKKKVSKFK
jgi:hypothetical protein